MTSIANFMQLPQIVFLCTIIFIVILSLLLYHLLSLSMGVRYIAQKQVSQNGHNILTCDNSKKNYMQCASNMAWLHIRRQCWINCICHKSIWHKYFFFYVILDALISFYGSLAIISYLGSFVFMRTSLDVFCYLV